ncbi:hypothetical protein SAMN05216345_11811 [Cupriavidus sp. YR651]|uniref:hypothetical protein n=1 Tax=Cupriavidus sp. YR651 TaxID=1855315 RepID=UPI000891C8A9|nr:hypothetical protein [Cupriavidus sp. YR651]SDD84351.1 hypothetical protein SAMN05216345_11811 [Cupriavidus sp. YR651]
MKSIVLAADGSAYGDAAAQCVAAGKSLEGPLLVHLAHCMPDVSGEVKSYIGTADLAACHSDESGRTMRSATEILSAAAVPMLHVQSFW